MTLPNLLDCNNKVIVIDPTFDNFELSHCQSIVDLKLSDEQLGKRLRNDLLKARNKALLVHVL